MTVRVDRAAFLAVGLLALVAGCGGGGGKRAGTTSASNGAATTTTAAVSPAQAAKVRALIARARQPQGASVRQSMRVADAQAELLRMSQSNPAAIAPLLAVLKKPDYDEILDLYNFYIQLGRPGSEKALIAALNHEGFTQRSGPIAFAFLASGNRRLIAGTRAWAARNGLTITGRPPAGARWGQSGIGP